MQEDSTDKISLVFLGTPAFSLPALQTLFEDSRLKILAVVTQPDRPAGRGQKLMPPPVKTLAEQLGLTVFQTESIRKDEPLKQTLRELQADFFVTLAFGQILNREVLELPKRATVNAHASLLPEFRGANPIQQALLQGKAETGITTMLTELGVDTGPMLLKHVLSIGAEETMGELTQRLSEAAGPLLVNTLVGMVDGTVQPETQLHELATHAPKCQKEDAFLDWAEPAEQLHFKIRAFNPAPGATTFLAGERIKILRATLHCGNAASDSEEILKSGEPGQILFIIEAGVLVSTGNNVLLLQSVQPAGKREMPARDWALGHFKISAEGQRTLGRFNSYSPESISV